MTPGWIIYTGRLVMRPVVNTDLDDLQALKSDPLVFAVMLGGVRSPLRTVEELAEEICMWGRLGVGIWSVRLRPRLSFLGIAGFIERADGRGISLRFAFRTGAQGSGFAAEAAGAALRFGHDRARLRRIVAVARADNIASRQLLGSIGFIESDRFIRDGVPMLEFESVRT